MLGQSKNNNKNLVKQVPTPLRENKVHNFKRFNSWRAEQDHQRKAKGGSKITPIPTRAACVHHKRPTRLVVPSQ